jgi:hypothetical protein
MDKWEILLASGLVGAVAFQELAHPGMEHLHHESQRGPDQPTGRAAAFTIATMNIASSAVAATAPDWRISDEGKPAMSFPPIQFR